MDNNLLIQLNTLKFVEYCRKSTEGEDRQAASLEDQHKDNMLIAKREHLNVTTLFTESKSAKSTGREVFLEMIDGIEKGKWNAILSWHANRLTRNALDGGRLIDLMDRKKLIAIVTRERTFLNNGNDKVTLQFDNIMSKKYVDDLSPTVRRGMKSKAEKGWTTARPKLGYKNVNLEDASVIQTVDEERFPLLRKAVDMILTGNYTVTKALDELNNKYNFRTRKTKKSGGKPLSKSRLYEILKDPYYFGEFKWGGDVNTKVHCSLPRLMTENEYWIIQKILGKVGIPRPRAESNVLAPYRGLIRCADCGCLYVPYRMFKKLSTGEIKERFYYRCSHDYKGGKCGAEQISLNALTQQITAILESITIPDEFFRWAIKWIKEDHQQETHTQEVVLNSLTAELERNQKKLNNLVLLSIGSETITSEEYDANRKTLETERENIKAQIASLEMRTTDWLDLAERTFNFGKNAKYHFENGDYETKTVILRALGTNFAIKNKRLFVELQKPFLEFKENRILLENDTISLEREELVGISGNTHEPNPGKSSWWTVPESNR